MWVVSPVSVDLFDRLVWMENGRYQSRQVSLTKTTMEMCHQRQSDVTATEFDDVYVKKIHIRAANCVKRVHSFGVQIKELGQMKMTGKVIFSVES